MLHKSAAWVGQQHYPLHPQRCALPVRAVGGQPSVGHNSGTGLGSFMSASSLTQGIKQASSIVELLQLHQAYRDRLDSIHYAAFFSKLLQAADYRMTAQQHQQHEVHMQQQRLHQQQQHPQEHTQQLQQVLLADLPYIIHNLQPGPLCSVLRVLVKLDVQLPPQLLQALLHRAQRGLGFCAFAPRELCTLAHALAELQPVQLPWIPHSAATAAGAHSSNDGSSSSWDPVVLQELFYALGRSLPRCNAQDAAQALLAVARLRYAPSEAWLQLWLQRATQLLPHFSPQGLANAAYGLIRALQLRGDVVSRGSSDWAQQPISAGSSSSSLQQDLQQQQSSALLDAAYAWLQSCLKVSVLHLSTLKPQELIGQLLWASGKLSCSPPEPARHHLLTSAEAMFAVCDARHLCAALYAFALLGHKPEPAAAELFWVCLRQQGPNLGLRDVDEVLWAAGKLHLQPPAATREQLQQQALLLLGGKSGAWATAAAGGSMADGPQALRHVVGVLRGMVGMGWKLQEKYVVRFQGALLEQLEACVPQDYANALRALAVAGAKVESRFLDQVLIAAASSLEQFTPQHLSTTVWALAQLQHNPPKPWLQQLLLASLQQMQDFKPVDYDQMLSGFAQLGFNPSPLWFSSFWSKSGKCLTQSNFTAAELHSLLLAVVKLEAQPPQIWLQAAAGAVERGLAGFGSQQLLEVLQALQTLWQASSAPPAAAAAAAGAGALASSNGVGQWTSSIVPISSSSSTCNHGLKLRRLLLSTSTSSSSQCAPGAVRLYRQLIMTNRMVVDGQGLIRPVWPPAAAAHVFTPGSSSSSSSGNGSSSNRGSTFGSASRSGWQQQLSSAYADEAYSMACLVLLMTPQLRSRVERWPQRLAADRAQQSSLGCSSSSSLNKTRSSSPCC